MVLIIDYGTVKLQKVAHDVIFMIIRFFYFQASPLAKSWLRS